MVSGLEWSGPTTELQNVCLATKFQGMLNRITAFDPSCRSFNGSSQGPCLTGHVLD